MLVFRRKPRAEMFAAHAAYAAKQEALLPPKREVVTANVEAVLDLGDTVYVSFRGRAFGVPPVAWRTSQRLIALRMETARATDGGRITSENSARYHQALGKLAEALWRHAFPTGKIRRALKFLHILRNPFQSGTEAELVALTDFFLQRRMTSTVGLPSVMHPQQSTTG